MKRTIRINAVKGDVSVRIEARLDTNAARLSADETNMIREQLAERLMETLPGLLYTHIRLPDVKVV